ncbi:MAG: Rieske 2Fe-2S domain-containing protein [Gemmataceae bacterium]|nr:Rieske 2Fe-2S domain-containing protein [Gemmataceae bacterium]
MAPSQDRRSFLRLLTHGLGTLIAVVLGAPAVAYLLDPVGRKARQSQFRLVDGVRLDDDAAFARGPVQGVIRDFRVDGWTLHPSDVVGRVWVVKDPAAANGFRVFTTICPHLGCSVNLGPGGGTFACPCHNAEFALDGARLHPEHNPARRGLDELTWRRNDADPGRLEVQYLNFKAGEETKIVVG